jgi:hypothetical protein|tara:strand:- start:875 stop:1069 length:195 start_codon:yes stop_codon:yes gene_type:complete
MATPEPPAEVKFAEVEPEVNDGFEDSAESPSLPWLDARKTGASVKSMVMHKALTTVLDIVSPPV